MITLLYLNDIIFTIIIRLVLYINNIITKISIIVNTNEEDLKILKFEKENYKLMLKYYIEDNEKIIKLENKLYKIENPIIINNRLL